MPQSLTQVGTEMPTCVIYQNLGEFIAPDRSHVSEHQASGQVRAVESPKDPVAVAKGPQMFPAPMFTGSDSKFSAYCKAPCCEKRRVSGWSMF